MPSRAWLWAAFVLVHVGLTWLGVVVVPAEAFHDVDLYRWWMYQALEQGRWPVLEGPWVYPVGAMVPMLIPALLGTVSTPGYALAWCVLVTALDCAALAVLLRAGRDHADSDQADSDQGDSDDAADPPRAALAAGWWWTAFLALLGPVAIGRLDAVVAPVAVVALTLALRHPRTAAALLTAGAWIKVAPGALLLPLVMTVRRPVRDLVLPAAAVCAVVVTAVAAGGGLRHVASFVGSQAQRGLQVESVTATPWVLASLVRTDVEIRLNEPLVTWEVVGPGSAQAAAVLDGVLLAAVGLLAALLLRARQEGRAVAALAPGAVAAVTTLIVANKVGSPQFVAWLAAPTVLWLLAGRSRTLPALVLVLAAATQVVFPWAYMGLLTGDPRAVLVLAGRNVLLVVVLAMAVRALVRVGAPVSPGEGRPRGRPDPGGPGPSGPAPAGTPAARHGRRSPPAGRRPR